VSIAGRDVRGAGLGAAVFVALVALSVVAFAAERAARSSDDLVNTVVLAPTVGVDGASIEFTLAKPDDDVTVRIIEGDDGSDGAVVATLASGAGLAAGAHRYDWDGKNDEGVRVPAGLYALEVILGQQGRDVQPPGRIEVPDNPLPPYIGG